MARNWSAVRTRMPLQAAYFILERLKSVMRYVVDRPAAGTVAQQHERRDPTASEAAS
jgi:hypothetical protein